MLRNDDRDVWMMEQDRISKRKSVKFRESAVLGFVLICVDLFVRSERLG